MRSFILVMLAALAGCAAVETADDRGSRGEVSYRAMDAAEDRYELREDEDFRTGAVRPDTRAVPVYPAQWLERAPREVWVCTELHIDAAGAVYDARALHPPPCSAADAAWDADFRAAVRAATAQWVFEPSYRCRLRDGARADGECRDAEALEAVPVSRAYRFLFRRTPQGGVVVGEGG